MIALSLLSGFFFGFFFCLLYLLAIGPERFLDEMQRNDYFHPWGIE